MQTKSKLFLALSLFINLILIGAIVYFFYFYKQDNRTQTATALFESKIQTAKHSLKNIKLSYSLMQDQYALNINEIRMIVEIMDLSKQFGLLTLKDHEEGKMIRLIEETRDWIAKKSIFTAYIKGMNEQLEILLTILKTKPSYETLKDIQTTITDIVAMMLQRSFVQTERFYVFTKHIQENLDSLGKELETPIQ